MSYVSLCLWREARGEGEDGIRAVAHVIRNRALAWYREEQEPFHRAVFSHGQFTSMSDPSDPQARLFPAEDDPVYQLCKRIAAEVVAGRETSPVGPAFYYANLEHITPGGWFHKYICSHPETHPILRAVGKHTFFA